MDSRSNAAGWRLSCLLVFGQSLRSVIWTGAENGMVLENHKIGFQKIQVLPELEEKKKGKQTTLASCQNSSSSLPWGYWLLIWAGEEGNQVRFGPQTELVSVGKSTLAYSPSRIVGCGWGRTGFPWNTGSPLLLGTNYGPHYYYNYYNFPQL